MPVSALRRSEPRECDVAKNRYDRSRCDLAFDYGHVGRLSAMRRAGTDQIDRAPSGVRKRRSHIRVPGMRVAPYLHNGPQLTNAGLSSWTHFGLGGAKNPLSACADSRKKGPFGESSGTANQQLRAEIVPLLSESYRCAEAGGSRPGGPPRRCSTPLYEFSTESGTFAGCRRFGLDTIGTARAGSARRQPGLLSERTRPSPPPSMFQRVLRCGELLRPQRPSEGEHARRNRRCEDHRSRRTR
jgi:hypothetical protein